jgi:hypothetical protein
MNHLFCDVVEFPVFRDDLVDELLVLLNVLGSAILDCFQELDVLLLNLLLLGLMLLDQLLHLPNLRFEIL